MKEIVKMRPAEKQELQIMGDEIEEVKEILCEHQQMLDPKHENFILNQSNVLTERLKEHER